MNDASCPPDAAEGRARDGALLGTLLGSVALQGVTILGTLVSWPIITRALSPAEFGIFTILTGFSALLGLMDFGVGAALTIKVADAVGRREHSAVRVFVAAALVAAAIAAVAVSAASVVIATALPWDTVLRRPGFDVGDVRLGVATVGLTLALTIIGNLGFRLLFSQQRGAQAVRLLAVSGVLSTASLIAVAALHGGLHWFVMASLAPPAGLSVTVLAAVLLRNPSLRPDFRTLRRTHVRAMLGHSGWFWLLSVCAALGFQSDALIVGAVLGAAPAGVFAVVMRLNGLINQTVQPSVLQLAPAFADALARGDQSWVRSRLRASTFLAGAIAGAMSIGLVLLAPWAIRHWLTPDLAPPLSLLVAGAVWQTYILASEPMFLLIQASGRVRIHAWMAIAMVIVNVPVSFVLTHEWGLAGPLWGSLVANVLCCGVPAWWYVRRLL